MAKLIYALKLSLSSEIEKS